MSPGLDNILNRNKAFIHTQHSLYRCHLEAFWRNWRFSFQSFDTTRCRTNWFRFWKLETGIFENFLVFFEFELQISRRKHLIQHYQQNFLSLIRFLFVVPVRSSLFSFFTDQGSTDRIGLKIFSVGRIRNRFHCVPNTWFIIRCFISNHWNILLWM